MCKDCQIINLDKLTYAGNLENLQDIENAAQADIPIENTVWLI